MNKNKVAQVLEEIGESLKTAAKYKFIKDPDHLHFPGVSFHRTKTGWSNSKTPPKSGEGSSYEEGESKQKPLIIRHKHDGTEKDRLTEGICQGNYFSVYLNLEVESGDPSTKEWVDSIIQDIISDEELDLTSLGREEYLKVLRELSNQFDLKKIHLYHSAE